MCVRVRSKRRINYVFKELATVVRTLNASLVQIMMMPFVLRKSLPLALLRKLVAFAAAACCFSDDYSVLIRHFEKYVLAI